MYEFTVEDPITLTGPWTAQIPTVRLDGLIYEFACHETNRGMVGILSGARARDLTFPDGREIYLEGSAPPRSSGAP